jgi:hypothetical protein
VARLSAIPQRWFERRDFLFLDLGREHIADPKGRCLVAFLPDFVRFLCRHPAVGQGGWDAAGLAPIMAELARHRFNSFLCWESAELVRQLLARGYVVDYVCGRHGYLIEDPSRYDVIIDEWTNLPAWAAANPRARKLFYATGSHWLFQNKAELTRHEWLLARRGVDVPPVRQVPPLLGPEHADLVSCFGAETARSSFGPNAAKVRKIWINPTEEGLTLQGKDWLAASRQFLFFGSSGWVHRGLDLVVEAFLKEPDLRLVIAGVQIQDNPTFWRVYGKEIEKAGNITVVGPQDVWSATFQDLTSSCAAVIYPSASEGCSGSVVECLHRGLIPLVTPAVGLELDGQFPPLAGATDRDLIDEIRSRCRAVSETPVAVLEEQRQFLWRYANTRHTRESFSQSTGRVLDALLAPSH